MGYIWREFIKAKMGSMWYNNSADQQLVECFRYTACKNI